MATISLTNAIPSYSQDFNTLNTSGSVSWVNDSTLSGWYAARTGTNNLTAGTGSSATGSLYSFGTGTNTERALGSVSSGTTGTVTWGVRIANNTGNTVTGFNINYVGEQWRSGGGTSPAQTVDFQYRIGGTDLTSGVWTDFNTLDFTSPIFSTTAGALDGNLVANQTAKSGTLSSLNLANGEEIWLRWSDIDHPSNDHGLAIDNFAISAIQAQAVPEPADMMGTALAVCAVAILKCKLSPAKKNKL
jgi:hypothetical protein